MEAASSPETILRELEERLLQPEVRRSAQGVAALLADDFMEFGSSGRVFTRQQIIESLQQESPTQRTLTEFQARTLAPGVILVTYRAIRHGKEQPVSSLRSSIWSLRDGRWQLVFHQGTLSTAE